jgi:hypothetical protein
MIKIHLKKRYIVLILIALIGLISLTYAVFPRNRYSVSNPPPDSYFRSKYTNYDDANACINEYEKYHTGGLAVYPCPGPQ